MLPRKNQYRRETGWIHHYSYVILFITWLLCAACRIILSEPQDGRKVADGWQKRRSGRRSRWKAHKAFCVDWECDCKGAKTCSTAKAHPGQAERGGYGSPGDTRLSMRQWRGPLINSDNNRGQEWWVMLQNHDSPCNWLNVRFYSFTLFFCFSLYILICEPKLLMYLKILICLLK